MRPGLAALLVLIWGLAQATPARADEYDPQRAGHPLRVVRYALYPVGVLLDRAIFRPAWAVGHWGPLRPLFGFEAPAVEVEAPTDDTGDTDVEER